MLGHETSLNNLKKIKKLKLYHVSFYNHNRRKLEISNVRKSKYSANTWRLNNILLNEEWGHIRSKGKFEKSLEMNIINISTLRRYRKSNVRRKVQSNECLSHKIQTASNKRSNNAPQRQKNKNKWNSKLVQRKKSLKLEKENKRIQKSSDVKSFSLEKINNTSLLQLKFLKSGKGEDPK